MDGTSDLRELVTPSERARNAAFVDDELVWFTSILDARVEAHASGEGDVDLLAAFPPPPVVDAQGCYARIVRELALDPAERLVVMLAVAPELRPAALDTLLIHNRALGRRFSEFGGVETGDHCGLWPTAETLLFLLAGGDLARRLDHEVFLDARHRLYRERLLVLDRQPGMAWTGARLRVTPEGRARLLRGEAYEPPFSVEFPARRITTELGWDQLILDDDTRSRIEDIIAWARHGDTILDSWGLRGRLTPGFRALFCGRPGTGKTMTACLLGKATGYPVYRIDMSQVISKYIGETEKNLGGLFDHAENQRWILFFDEADALFGQRGESQTANDRAANQQVAYLLQRFEQYSGIAVLATNLRSNIDDAFTRRFQMTVEFALPGTEQRRQMWANNFEQQAFALARDVNLDELAEAYPLSGGSIVNVLRLACLRAAEREPPMVRRVDLVRAIQRELAKEGKVLRVRSQR